MAKIIVFNPREFHEDMRYAWTGFEFTDITDEGLSHITNKMTDVTEFRLMACPFITDKCLEYVARLPNLEELDISGTRMNGSGLHFLANCLKLKRLELVAIKTLDPEFFHNFSTLTQIEYLGLSHCELPSSVLSYIAKCRSLNCLVLHENSITDEDAPFLCELENLEILSLDYNDITDVALSYISELKSLYSLDLVGNSITDIGVDRVQDLNSLTGLNLSGTQITDRSMKVIAQFPHLRVLDVWQTAITDEGLRILSEGPASQTLMSLSLKRTQLTQESVPLLLERFPVIESIDVEGTQIQLENEKNYYRFINSQGKNASISWGDCKSLEEDRKDHQPLPTEEWIHIEYGENLEGVKSRGWQTRDLDH